MQSDGDFWKDYCEKSKNKTIDSLVLKAFDFIRNQEALDILDVGAGAGINANYLLIDLLHNLGN